MGYTGISQIQYVSKLPSTYSKMENIPSIKPGAYKNGNFDKLSPIKKTI